jgi:hypothetical protein
MPWSTTVVRVAPVSQKIWLNPVTWAMSRSSRSAIGWRVFGTSPLGVLCST